MLGRRWLIWRCGLGEAVGILRRTKLDDFLRLSDHEVLTHAGQISAEQARQKTEIEYKVYRNLLDQQPSEVDKHLAEAIEKLGKIEQKPKP